MGNKVKLITPFLMLFAGAVASIIMYIRNFELVDMLWILLIVLLVFYVIGDIIRYIYAAIRPRIITQDIDYSDFIPLSIFNDEETGKVRTLDGEEEGEEVDAGAFVAAGFEASMAAKENNSDEGYSEEDLQEYGDEYSDESE